MIEYCVELPDGFSFKNVDGFTIILDPEDNAILQFAEELDLSQDRFKEMIEKKIKESQTIFLHRSAQ